MDSRTGTRRGLDLKLSIHFTNPSSASLLDHPWPDFRVTTTEESLASTVLQSLEDFRASTIGDSQSGSHNLRHLLLFPSVTRLALLPTISMSARNSNSSSVKIFCCNKTCIQGHCSCSPLFFFFFCCCCKIIFSPH